MRERCPYVSRAWKKTMKGRTILLTVMGAVFGAISLAGIVQLGGVEVILLQGIVGTLLGGALGYRLSLP